MSILIIPPIKNMTHLASSVVVGGAGFIGSNLVMRLLAEGIKVIVMDNFSAGRHRYLDKFKDHPNLKLIEVDISIRTQCRDAFNLASHNGSIYEIWHMAANSDISAGVSNPNIDLKDTFLTTFELLLSAEEHEISNFHFASSSAIYGDLGSAVLKEDIGPLLPISNYGAMKLASEAQLSAAAEKFLTRLNIFRFPNVVGTPATHGVILDFIKKLAKNNQVLDVLGNGAQKKSYLHVSDLIDAMLFIRNKSTQDKVEVINIGPSDDGVTVKWIAEQVVSRVSPNARIIFGEGPKGWVGDVPRFTYSTERLRSFGWFPKLNSCQSVSQAIDEIVSQFHR